MGKSLKLSINPNSMLKGLSYIVLIELILGGAGKLVSFGAISLRMLLVGIIFIIEFSLMVKGKLIITKKDIIFWIVIIWFLINATFSLLENDVGDVMDALFGYLTLLIYPFFSWLEKNNEGIYKVWFKIFMKCSFLLAIISILFWIYAFINGKSIYYTFMVRLNDLAYSRMGFVGSVPRIFLKGSIFVVIGCVFSLYRFIANKSKDMFRNLIVLIIYFIAVIFTFTIGFYLVLFVGTVFIFASTLNKKTIKVFVCGMLGGLGIIFISQKLELGHILMNKFENGYTASTRIIQLRSVLDEIIKFPEIFIGKGFGTRFYIDYGYVVTNHYNLEIMWLKLWADAGIIGLFLYGGSIVGVINRLNNLYRKLGICELLLFEVGLIMICLISFINPYMNNTIGIIYFVMCIGLTNVRESV